MYRALQAAQQTFQDADGPIKASKLKEIVRDILAQVRFCIKKEMERGSPLPDLLPLNPSLKKRRQPPFLTPSLPCSSLFLSSGAAGGDGGVRVGGTEGHDGGNEGGGAAKRGGDYLVSVAVGQGAVD